MWQIGRGGGGGKEAARIESDVWRQGISGKEGREEGDVWQR